MKNFLEESKIESKVFDKRTLFSIFKLMKKNVIKNLVSVVKEGKESVVFSGKNTLDEWIAIKVYRVEYCDFKSMWKYLTSDNRFNRVKKKRWDVIVTWAKREFKNMKIAFKHGVSMPKPISLKNNVLVMSFIGVDGIPAPMLLQVKKANWRKVYKQVVDEMKKLAEAKLVHTDLSPYNILFLEKPYIIDFSQAVSTKHPLAKEFLKRDVENINSYFKKKGVRVNKKLEEELKAVYQL